MGSRLVSNFNRYLKPCPKCGCNGALEESGMYVFQTDIPCWLNAVCTECGFQSEIGFDIGEALARWNESDKKER